MNSKFKIGDLVLVGGSIKNGTKWIGIITRENLNNWYIAYIPALSKFQNQGVMERELVLLK